MKIKTISDIFAEHRRFVEKAFCPTGQGGGIDNSCGRGGSSGIGGASEGTSRDGTPIAEISKQRNSRLKEMGFVDAPKSPGVVQNGKARVYDIPDDERTEVYGFDGKPGRAGTTHEISISYAAPKAMFDAVVKESAKGGKSYDSDSSFESDLTKWGFKPTKDDHPTQRIMEKGSTRVSFVKDDDRIDVYVFGGKPGRDWLEYEVTGVHSKAPKNVIKAVIKNAK